MTGIDILAAFLDGTRLVLAGLFLVTVIPKILNQDAFRKAISRYQVVPPRNITIVALAITAGESALAMALPFRQLSGFAAVIGTIILSAFSVGMILNLKRRRQIPCGCRGRGDEPISWRKVSGNILIIVSLWSLYLGDLEKLTTSDASLASGALLALVALGVAFLFKLSYSIRDIGFRNPDPQSQ